MKENLFLGIDLGGKKNKTTGVFILKENKGLKIFLKDKIFGGELFKKISPYLKFTKTVAIDAPLTKGRGKGKMRLFEKFLSQKIFREEKINPIPPALMPELCNFALELRKKMAKKGFVLDFNLIETFPTFLEKILNFKKIEKLLKDKKINFENKDEKMAFYCAILAFLHSKFKTRYLGYKDGFLFLPELSFWKEKWQKEFQNAWNKKDRLKYRYLISNLFD
jgi:predicted nuclease with RNAse H fold